MARYPGADWRPIADGAPMVRYDLLILHTCVGSLAGTDGYFRSPAAGGNNSHFGLGGKWGPDAAGRLDGRLWQWVDTGTRSGASRDGNWRSISVECADNAPESPADLEPWTPAQQETLVELIVWCHNTHGIPLQAAPDSRPTSRGIGYHQLGCDPYRAPGGELWSKSFGKVCPGSARIAQIPGLIQRAQRALDGTVDEEHELDRTQAQQLGTTFRWVGDIGQRIPVDFPAQLSDLRSKVLALAADIEQIPVARSAVWYVQPVGAREIYEVDAGRARHVTAEEWAARRLSGVPVVPLDPAKDAALLGQLGIAPA